ncbi:hypothetical protein EDD86DRAFT_212360 [Gorgonomyces haynaldii]|nr:hypothetical protein EDD86DRAFT_212360 [Gorgonomyces haynaldii]
MWVGVGFSATGSMLGSRAMVAVINDTLNVYQYEVEIQGRLIYRYPVETQPNSTSIGISQTYDKRGLIYYFQRPILENLDSVPQIFSNGTSNYIMCAHGNVKDGKIYQHGPNKTVVAVDFTH